ncbi:hypothetical protein MTBLM1_90174 [Rhodospirillaceae bacterium LM-1]|nr:hypothetical protein MTBLM1_90174 [Rhodospirillaceae bacterium LM-1]
MPVPARHQVKEALRTLVADKRYWDRSHGAEMLSGEGSHDLLLSKMQMRKWHDIMLPN